MLQMTRFVIALEYQARSLVLAQNEAGRWDKIELINRLIYHAL